MPRWVYGQKPRRTKAPKDRRSAILSARTETRDTFKQIFHSLSNINHTFFPIKQKLNKRSHIFCMMPLTKNALSIGLAYLLVYLMRFVIHVVIHKF